MAFLMKALDIYLGHERDFFCRMYVCILNALKIVPLFLLCGGMSSIEKGPYQLWIVLNHNCGHPESLTL